MPNLEDLIVFCPNDYLTLNEIAELVPPFLDFNNRKDSIEFSRFEGESLQDMIENKCFSLLLEKSAVHLCSPSGTVVRFWGAEIFDKVDFPKELEPFLDPITEAQLGVRKPIVSHEIAVDYFGVDGSDSMPRPALPLFFQRSYYVVSLKNYRLLRELALRKWNPEEVNDALALNFELDPFWDIIQRFEGWSICAPRDDFTDLTSNHTIEIPKFESESTLVSRILKALELQEFRTKREAFDLVAGSASHRKFNMAWARAAEMKPELSAPGRKGS